MGCIGTAGHVDHGKSTLVRVLTGIDPDRLAEEKERGMTIDLGFAWLTLPGGREVSIVDVPGHESFIKNMLAGIGGIDAALLVVAADEGVMPQTREHLAILDLLHVRRGVVALTKIDLVDEEWLELVREEVAEQLKPTTLADAPILPVCAHTGQGLGALLAELDRILAESQYRQNIARPRLPIDRVFSMTGFGTIVTGTLLDGTFKAGQEVVILPQGIKTRIRGLQTHKQQVEAAQPGNRVAMNLINVNRTDLERGNIVALPGQMRTTILFDVRIHLLTTVQHPLLHNSLVDFYSGSQEIPARVRLLDTDELQPGESAWAQLRLARPVVVARRDRFILRLPSPSMTIGGGEIVDVQPRYHRRFQQPVVEVLERLEQGLPEELVLAALDRRRSAAKTTVTSIKSWHGLIGYELTDIVKVCNLSEDVTQRAIETLLSEGRVRQVGSFWFAQPIWDALVEESASLLREYHQLYPLRSGLSKEEWRTRLKFTPKMASEVFAQLQEGRQLEVVVDRGAASSGGEYRQEALLRAGGLIRLPTFTPCFTAEQLRQVERLLQHFRESPYMPPGRVEAEKMVGADVLTALLEQGQLVKLGDSVLFLRETYDEAITRLVIYLREYGKITVAEARDLLGASRKYILPLLEHMDVLHITRRMGDERILGTMALRPAETNVRHEI